jgi:archaellum component FlaG (FlaF/FlaG flagellin family)
MKKLLSVLVFLMAVGAMNAQQTRTPVKVTDLNKAITDNITKDYAGFIIKDATQIVNNGATTYEVVISKGTTSETLLYDNAGKFLNKVNMTAGTAGKSGMTKKSGSGHMAHKSAPKKK